jgi:uncharacterized protein YbjT (DUF2867 family)
VAQTVLVLGGTGIVGRCTVNSLLHQGANVRTFSRGGGEVAEGALPFRGDLSTGEGLESALQGVDSVVDVSTIRSLSAKNSEEFFSSSTKRLHEVGERSGLTHVVALSIVGIDAAPYSYYVGKLKQESLVLDGPVPGTVLRATQFHEMAAQMAGRFTRGPFTFVPDMPVQPVAAAEVGAVLSDLALGAPAGRVPDVAGPRQEKMVSMVRRYLRSKGIRRTVVPIPMSGRYGKVVREGALLADASAKLVGPSFTEWLSTGHDH